jgi:hypothetical protein
MRFHFKFIIIMFLLSQAGAVGTQFLSIPPSAHDLIYFNSHWRNPAMLNQINKVPELGLAYGNWLAGVQSFGFRWKGQIKMVVGAWTFDMWDWMILNYVPINPHLSHWPIMQLMVLPSEVFIAGVKVRFNWVWG